MALGFFLEKKESSSSLVEDLVKEYLNSGIEEIPDKPE